MYSMIKELSDNYVKSDKHNESKIAYRRDAQMIIKLAYYNDRTQEKDIRMCCESNGSLFIPIFENKFGILTEALGEPLFGRDSGEQDNDFGIKTFIDVYNCVDKLEKDKPKYLFWGRKYPVPYVGELLDNKFFLNILFVILTDKKMNVELNYLYVLTKVGTPKKIEDPHEVMKGFKEDLIERILKLSFNLEGQDITINKKGYIGISTGIEFFKENDKVIKGLILNGFRGEYGKYYL
jgi:hypothetical protein